MAGYLYNKKSNQKVSFFFLYHFIEFLGSESLCAGVCHLDVLKYGSRSVDAGRLAKLQWDAGCRSTTGIMNELLFMKGY